MRVLVLGANGMLGHRVWSVCEERFDTWGTVRPQSLAPTERWLADSGRVLMGVDATTDPALLRAFESVRPDVVVNCVGVVKQRPEAGDALISIAVNALLPHRLASLCSVAGARLIHISTDCVFSGRTGGYTEEDVPDAEDLYGRTKHLGEVRGPNALTLRTSIIGRELTRSTGLVEWFLSNRGGAVLGYRGARFSGVTTSVLARLIAELISDHPSLDGLYQVASTPIDKFELLGLLNEAFGADVEITPTDDVRVDRSLVGNRLRLAVGWEAPSWPDMVEQLAEQSRSNSQE